MRQMMLLVVIAAAITVAETLSIGGARAQQASSGSQVAISVSSVSQDFGTVTVGTNSSPQFFTITNVGEVPINTFHSFSENNPPYAVRGPNCQNLQPGQSCQVQVIFQPQKAGPTTVILTLVGRPITGSLPDSAPHVVSLTGVGV